MYFIDNSLEKYVIKNGYTLTALAMPKCQMNVRIMLIVLTISTTPKNWIWPKVKAGCEILSWKNFKVKFQGQQLQNLSRTFFPNIELTWGNFSVKDSGL